MAQGRKIESMGLARVVSVGSGCVGNMAWETPYIEIRSGGEIFRWQSDRVEPLELHVGDMLAFTAFARANNNLYRVVINGVTRQRGQRV